jgi:hypothetical protein
MSGDAHARKPIRSLAKAVNCRYCDRPVYVAICRDGKWRTFERELRPASPITWAWRKTYGMEETDKVPGYSLHYCAEYNRVDPATVLYPQERAS